MYNFNYSFTEKFKNNYMFGGVNSSVQTILVPSPSSGIPQYSQYGNLAHIVESMVDNDNITYVKPFYESLSSDILKVEYIDNFYEALEKINSNTFNKGVIVSRIVIVNQDHIINTIPTEQHEQLNEEDLSKYNCSCNTSDIICNSDIGDKYSSHAVSLFKHKINGKIYMFDPNGVFNKLIDTWLYQSDNNLNLYDTEKFEKYLNLNGVKIELPKNKGIQSLAAPPNNGYIDDAGYCMFYNYLGIQRVIEELKQKNKKHIMTLIKELTDFQSEINEDGDFVKPQGLQQNFPSDDEMGIVSHEIIKNIFNK